MAAVGNNIFAFHDEIRLKLYVIVKSIVWKWMCRWNITAVDQKIWTYGPLFFVFLCAGNNHRFINDVGSAPTI